MEYHERPGVYTDYDLSSVWYSGSGSKTVALAAVYEGSGISTLTSLSQATALLADAPVALNLVRLLFLNGAGTVLVCPVQEATSSGYAEAMKTLLAEKTASFLICDSSFADMETAVKTAVTAASQEGNECIGIVGLASSTSAALTARAKLLNSERVVLVSGTATLSWDETVSGDIYGAAALAGLLAGEEDPALPVNGAALKGLCAITQRFEESEIDTLVKGGVTQLECVGGVVSAIRAVTTRTTTDGAADASWRELTTILIVDDVIPGVRQALRTRFLRKKNNETTRGAIRSLVAVELENRVKREIIDSYGEISVEADAEDPTVCNVAFPFTVTHGMSRIFLTAHITV